MTNSASFAIEACDLSKTYRVGGRSLEVLRGVSLHVSHGAFIALRGASGAGKSTLLHLLAGLDLPDKGTILVDGTDLHKRNAAELAHWRNLHIGLIFQAYHLLPELNAIENVTLPARILRSSHVESVSRAKMLLEKVGLGGRIEHRPYELSGGEQQRVAIARALINNPSIIFADEPTGNLDSRTGQEILELLLTLRAERGSTLIIATHDSKVADRASQTIQLIDGKID